MMKQQHPDRQECLRLLHGNNTPEHVIRHCQAVCDAAVKIGAAMNAHGYDFDLELVQAAGMLHDIARVEEEHWLKGGDLVEQLGYPQEADIIRAHMFYTFSPMETFHETDLVCLGDRLVKEDEYVGLDKRIQYVIEKVEKRGGDPEARKIILEKKKQTAALIRQIEEIIGTTLDQLMKGE